MVYMIEKKFVNKDLEIELTSFIDNKQNVWFLGEDIAQILGYSDTKQAIRKHVSAENKIIQLSRQQVLGVSKRPINADYCPVEMKGQQNASNVGVEVSPRQQTDTGGKFNLI